MEQQLLLALVGLIGGAFGAMVGLGGGVFIIPALVLFLGVPIQQAISASLVAVVATSSAAAATYLREDLSNVRLGITMETGTAVGAVVGGFVAAALSREALSAVFGAVMMVVALYMGTRQRASTVPVTGADTGRFGGVYYDRTLERVVAYRVKRLPIGLITALVAGNVSGLLGVGGGFLNVPVMVLAMGVPIRAAVSTSSLMIGVTACAGAMVYFARGLVDPLVAVPVVLGVTAGALIGSRVGRRARGPVLTVVLAGVLFVLALQMLLAAFGVSVR